MAAASQVLGKENLQDTSRGEFFQTNLHDTGTAEKKEYLEIKKFHLVLLTRFS